MQVFEAVQEGRNYRLAFEEAVRALRLRTHSGGKLMYTICEPPASPPSSYPFACGVPVLLDSVGMYLANDVP